MDKLPHVGGQGSAHMVGGGSQPITARVAIAEGHSRMGAPARAAVVDRTAKKGDVLAIAQLAGIQAAKRTSDLIPLCHPLPLSAVDVQVRSTDQGVMVRATVRADWRTGVEMEALTSVTAALLTVYDMLKAIDRGMEIGAVRLVEKHGGQSGSWVRTSEPE